MLSERNWQYHPEPPFGKPLKPVITRQRTEIGNNSAVYLPMDVNRIHTLYRATLVVFVLNVFLLLYMMLTFPNEHTLWSNRQWAEEQIQQPQTLEDLRQLTRAVAGKVEMLQLFWGGASNVFMLVTGAMIGFLGWSVFEISDIKREFNRSLGRK
jgi:hypothetical protein